MAFVMFLNNLVICLWSCFLVCVPLDIGPYTVTGVVLCLSCLSIACLFLIDINSSKLYLNSCGGTDQSVAVMFNRVHFPGNTVPGNTGLL